MSSDGAKEDLEPLLRFGELAEPDVYIAGDDCFLRKIYTELWNSMSPT